MVDSHRKPVADLTWENRFQALGTAYGRPQSPTELPGPFRIAVSDEAAALIDLDTDDPAFVSTFAGNRTPAGSQPFAHRYAGHQFGMWVPQLGDGRVVSLGQVRNRAGKLWDVQLKGAGKTPYSRHADGRAMLASTVREYLVSEAMAGLGIPTTRALCVIGSTMQVARDTWHPAAVLTRLAPTHVRFGSFEYLFYRSQFDDLAPLADHVIELEFPDLADQAAGPARYQAWVAGVIERTTDLMAAWQSVGFVHGVMNTDNMSVAGLTLDYGPFGFMDDYQPDAVFNHTDETRRYAFDRQPDVALWNLGCFVQAILPLLSDDPDIAIGLGQDLLKAYRPAFDAAYSRRMAAKLGLPDTPATADLRDRLLALMAGDHADFTRSFRGLCSAAAGDEAAWLAAFTRPDEAAAWLRDWRAAWPVSATTMAERLAEANPRYVLRNYLAEQAILAAQAGDHAEIERLQRLLTRPFDEQPAMADYAQRPPAWAADLALSCTA
ncbi:protein adenylyltransferase SelO [Spectribacter hydrogenooxidans]|uniref:Protein nucleotidyltransferase YdiU n=1 Tax=Spectribacter hydrogenoxidans TaxID=3075608 RepID=A0ABU3BZV9_9GAMM|nr:YdiU family protein [Salinisphaera sp. W335]MDT0634825.1 YdiU family protein [Salinisphaera sp. W335]